MLRKRDSAAVKADAIRMGVKKLRAGCERCAQGYFRLALDHGATEEDIQTARANLESTTALAPSRRHVLKTAGAAVTGIAASALAGGFLPELVRAATTAPADARSVHWMLGLVDPPAGSGGPLRTSSAGPLAMVGVDALGQVVGRIDSVLDTIFRSPDGKSFYVPWSRWDGGQVNLVVDILSAATGDRASTILGHALPLNGADTMWEDLSFGISRDSRQLATLRVVRRMFGDLGTKEQPGAFTSTVTIGVEMVDLKAGRSVDYLELETIDGKTADGDQLYLSPQGDRVYVFSRRFKGAFRDSATVIDFDGNKLHAGIEAVNGEAGRTLPFVTRQPSVITADGKTLVRYHPPFLDFVDLGRMTVAGQLQFPFDLKDDPRFPPTAIPNFAPDRTTLYMANPGDGNIQLVDLVRRRVVTHVVLPLPRGQSSILRQPINGLNRHITTLSPDGSHLYLAEHRGSVSGVWSVRLPELRVEGRFLNSNLASAVSVAPDGGSLAILGQPEGRLFVLKRDGTLVATLSAANVYSFGPQHRA